MFPTSTVETDSGALVVSIDLTAVHIQHEEIKKAGTLGWTSSDISRTSQTPDTVQFSGSPSKNVFIPAIKPSRHFLLPTSVQRTDSSKPSLLSVSKMPPDSTQLESQNLALSTGMAVKVDNVNTQCQIQTSETLPPCMPNNYPSSKITQMPEIRYSHLCWPPARWVILLPSLCEV